MKPLSPDLQPLLQAVEAEARQRLANTGEVWPFGCDITADGFLSMVVTKHYPDHTRGRVMDDITDCLVRLATENGYIGVAMVTNGNALDRKTAQQSKAILIHLEDILGDCRMVAIPFSRGLFENQWVCGKPEEHPLKPVVYPRVLAASPTTAARPGHQSAKTKKRKVPAGPPSIGEVLFLEKEIPSIPWPSGYYVLCGLSDTTATLAMVSEDARGLYGIDNPYTLPVEDLPAFSRTGETARTSK